MALVTTIGAPTQNSFCTVSAATTFLAAQPFWLAQDTTDLAAIQNAQKEQGLVYAALAMNYLPWRGQRAYGYQPLCWPRVGLGLMYQMSETSLVDLYEAQVQAIPDVVWQAQALIWWYVMRRGFASMRSVAEGFEPAQVTSVSLAGLITVQFNPQGSVAVGSSLNRLITSSEFPIYILLSNLLSRVRFRGDRGRYRMKPWPALYISKEEITPADADAGDLIYGGTDANATFGMAIDADIGGLD